jgi:hypothetical protein
MWVTYIGIPDLCPLRSDTAGVILVGREVLPMPSGMGIRSRWHAPAKSACRNLACLQRQTTEESPPNRAVRLRFTVAVLTGVRQVPRCKRGDRQLLRAPRPFRRTRNML